MFLKNYPLHFFNNLDRLMKYRDKALIVQGVHFKAKLYGMFHADMFGPCKNIIVLDLHWL